MVSVCRSYEVSPRTERAPKAKRGGPAPSGHVVSASATVRGMYLVPHPLHGLLRDALLVEHGQLSKVQSGKMPPGRFELSKGMLK